MFVTDLFWGCFCIECHVRKIDKIFAWDLQMDNRSDQE